MFLSHTSSLIPESYHVIEQLDKKKVLVKSDDIRLISNVCPHQHSIISDKSGTGNRTCPYHNWTFTIDGLPVTSGRTGYYCKNHTPLETEKVFEWNSLLFDSIVDFDISESFSGMVLMETRVDLVKADYRVIMDLFLDVDHIQSIHAGVYDLIGISDTTVDWDYYTNGSVQTVKQGAKWIAVYPNTMIEWQLGSLFITVATPDIHGSIVHVFKYTEVDHPNWLLNERVWELAWAQDKHQAELITNLVNFNLEPQKVHFRDFLKANDIN